MVRAFAPRALSLLILRLTYGFKFAVRSIEVASWFATAAVFRSSLRKLYAALMIALMINNVFMVLSLF